MRGDNAPRALHHELNEKRAEDQQRRVRRKGPKRNHQDRQHKGRYHAPAPAETVRKQSKNNAAAQRANVVDHSDHSDLPGRKPALSLRNRGYKSWGPWE